MKERFYKIKKISSDLVKILKSVNKILNFTYTTPSYLVLFEESELLGDKLYSSNDNFSIIVLFQYKSELKSSAVVPGLSIFKAVINSRNYSV